MNEAIIQTKGLSKQFGDTIAVQNVTFEVPRARIFGFIGPSGSGKTTTIRMLTGYYAPTSGEVSVFGCPPMKFTRQQREKIGYLPQLFVLYPNLSIWENLNFAASMYGISPFRKARLNQILDLVELREHRKKLARNISGGMQRRLNLAATLLHEPELIFLDEPTAGVDPILRRKFWGHFRELRDEGRTLFITTQYVGEATYCDLVGVMGNGRLLVVDTPDGLHKRAYGGDMLDLHTEARISDELIPKLENLPFVQEKPQRRGEVSVRLVVNEASTGIPALFNWCREENIQVKSLEEYLPPFDDVFVEIMKQEMGKDG